MHPYLFDLAIGGHHLKPPTYGVLLAIAFSAAYFESLRRATQLEESPKHIENLFLIIVLSSVFGARFFHVAFEDPNYYWQNPGEIIAIWNGGYTLYGALLLSILTGWWYTRKSKIDFRQFADIAAPGIAVGIGIGRLGCFFAGCCWGLPTDLPWAATFSHPEAFTDPSLKNTPVHPTQIYESFGAFLIYAYLWWLFPRRKYRGQVMFHMLAAYSILRFIVEGCRGDAYRGFMFGGLISYSQFISLSILPFALLGIYLYRKKEDA